MLIANLYCCRNLVSASQDGKLIVWDSYSTNKVGFAVFRIWIWILELEPKKNATYGSLFLFQELDIFSSTMEPKTSQLEV
jgi:hypothetical protein